MANLKSIIERHPFFQGLGTEHLDLLTGCARNQVFREGEVVFREGDRADTFFLVRHGRIALEIHAPGREPLTIGTVQDGEVFGASWLIPPFERQFDARAVTLVRVLALDGSCLRDKCDQDPLLGYQLMQRFAAVLVRRLQATRYQLLDVFGPKAPR